jgi:hypothetical protein
VDFTPNASDLFEASRTQIVSPSSEYDRKPKKNYCDRHERRSGDVGDEHEDDRDNGEDGGYSKVHSLSWVCRYLITQDQLKQDFMDHLVCSVYPEPPVAALASQKYPH